MIYFRVDSNNVISAGHVMRCLAIAEALRLRTVPCAFLCADKESNELIEGKGFECTVLDGDWRNLDIEVPQLLKLLRKDPAPVVMIDTYSVDSDYVANLHQDARLCYLGSKALVAPDLSLLVNYSTKIDVAFYERTYAASSAKLCLGPSYAPLRKEFVLRDALASNDVKTVLITTGNTDNEGFANALLKSAVASKLLSNVRFRVVVGPLFQKSDQLKREYGNHARVDLLFNATDMSSIMRSSDLAVSACGTTLYELAACGVPTVGFSLVPEQSASGYSLSELGVIEYAGAAYEDLNGCVGRIVSSLERLAADKEERCSMSKEFHKLSDGRGCDRICDELMLLLEE